MKRFDEDYNEFLNDAIFYNAVAMMLLQIGEHSTRVSEELSAMTADQIPWGKLRSLRNMLAHEYEVIVTPKLWTIAINDIPVLLNQCTTLIAQHGISEEPIEAAPWGTVREGLAQVRRIERMEGCGSSEKP